MTRCPVCRGRADPECFCEGTGVVEDAIVGNVPPTVRDYLWLWAVPALVAASLVALVVR